MIELGHTLGLLTVAEGVEHPRALRQLADLGCDSAQGYAIGPAMPAAALARWLAESPWPITCAARPPEPGRNALITPER